MLVSVIIPAYNAEATLAECLDACARQTYASTEVIVVDDGSTDGTRRIAETYPVRYVRQENAGPAAARNRGARAADGEIVAFTDSDCVPAADWVEALVSGFEDGVAAVGGGYDIANGSSPLARMIHEEIVMRHANFDRDVDFLGSFNVAYRRTDFEAAGGFDESFRTASGEDNDLAYRLSDAGGTLRFVARAKVAHYHPARLWPYLRTQGRHGYWRMKLYAKHPQRAQRGDQYAGIVDLAAPALSLASIVSALTAGAWVYSGAPPILVAAALCLVLAYGLTRVGLPSRMAVRTHDPAMLGFVPVMICRDVARGIGMIGGIWRFLLADRGVRR